MYSILIQQPITAAQMPNAYISYQQLLATPAQVERERRPVPSRWPRRGTHPRWVDAASGVLGGVGLAGQLPEKRLRLPDLRMLDSKSTIAVHLLVLQGWAGLVASTTGPGQKWR